MRVTSSFNPNISVEEVDYNGNPINTKGILRFNYLNGSMELNEFEYGAYAICPGCGSGKTTNICNLIALRWYEGIFYAAFTRDEVNEMYAWIVDNVVGKIPDRTGNYLTKDDIIVLHSDYSKNGTDKDLWLNRPQELADKKVILCTHAKLLDEPLYLFLSSTFTMTPANLYGPITSTLMGMSGSLPRQWMIIDESTEAKVVKKILKKLSLFIFSSVINRKVPRLITDPITGIKRVEMVDDKPSLQLRFEYMTYSSFKDTMKSIMHLDKSIKQVLGDNGTEIGRLKSEQFIEYLFRDFTELVNRPGDEVVLYHNYTDIIVPGMQTHLLLFDGTSDITLLDSSFEVIRFDNKYNSPVNINTFNFGLNRYVKVDKSIPDIDAFIRIKLDSLVNSLESIIKVNEKTLIFTWMNFKPGEAEINDELTDSDIIARSTTTKYGVNPKMNLPYYLTIELKKRGVDPSKFSIEYYGSGKDKAVNTYKDYDAVVLAGAYHVPNYVIDEFNYIFKTKITSVEYYSNRIVQAVCRTRIRKHNGEPINVYFSSDWSNEIIEYVNLYLNNNNSSIVKNISRPDIDHIIMDLLSIGMTPKRAEKVAKLCLLDKNILTSLKNGYKYSATLDLNEVFHLIPMSQKKSKEYGSIIDYISRFNIKLSIM